MKELLAAAGNGDLNALRTLLASGADINSMDPDLGTALHRAAFRNQCKVVALLLDAGAKPGLATERGTTPLMLACHEGYWDATKVLLEAGASVSAVNAEGTTALHFASGYGDDVTVLDLLVQHGADLEAQRVDGATALMWAAGAGKEKHVRALLRLGASPTTTDSAGKTALERARERGREGVVAILSAL